MALGGGTLRLARCKPKLTSISFEGNCFMYTRYRLYLRRLVPNTLILRAVLTVRLLQGIQPLQLVDHLDRLRFQ